MDNNLFQFVNVPDRPSTQFNGDHISKFTTRIGDLTPYKCILYHPGDKFRMRNRVAANFPPLIAPAYQKFTMKQYSFKVRKGLTWQEKSLGKYLTSLTDGSLAPQMPYMLGDDLYWFGSVCLGVRFTPHIPVFGMVDTAGNINIQSSNLPNVPCITDFLHFGPDSTRWIQYNSLMTPDYFKSMFKTVIIDKPFTNKKYSHNMRDFHKEVLRDSFGCYFNLGGDVLDPMFNLPTNTSWTEDEHGNRFHVSAPAHTYNYLFNNSPLARVGGLLEYLGYKFSNYAVDQTIYSKMDDLISAWSNVLSYQYSAHFPLNRTDAVLPDVVSLYSFKPFTEYDVLTFDSSSYEVVEGSLPTYDLFVQYANWCIKNGYGDGTIPPDDLVPTFFTCPLSYLFSKPMVGDDGSSKQPDKYDLGRFTAFWKVYSDYFRDPNITEEIDFSEATKDGSTFYSFIQSIMTSRSDFSDFDHEILDPLFQSLPEAQKFYGSWLMHKYTTIPRKMLDRDYFSSLLPSTTRINVFAPAVSADIAPENSVSSIPEWMNNSDFFDNRGSAPDYKPEKLSSVDSNAFISVDAFRTAELMQQFFREATLCGNKPVQLVLLIWGVHSQDFRMEMPQLISANSSPIQIQEITQSSETSELPLGSEAGKMYCITDNDYIEVDSEGDFGYIINLCCIYPDTALVSGLDPSLLASDPWDWCFLPQFSILGEEKVQKYQAYYGLKYADVGESSFRSCGQTLGYTPRYSRFKFIPSEVHGRFLTDMNHWTLDRIGSPFDDDPSLNVPFMTTPLDLRLFASDEEQNCYCIAVSDCEYIRSLTPQYHSILG